MDKDAQDRDTVCIGCGQLPYLCLCLDEVHQGEALRLREIDLESIGGE